MPLKGGMVDKSKSMSGRWDEGGHESYVVVAVFRNLS